MVIQKEHLEQIPEGTIVSKSSLSKDINQDSGNGPILEQPNPHSTVLLVLPAKHYIFQF